eukprot:scaffold68045_cov48-Phaeocystis_antarctica.AAC.1
MASRTCYWCLTNARLQLRTTRYSLRTTRYSLPTAHCTLLTAHHSSLTVLLRTTHHSLSYCALLTAHYPLRATHHSPCTVLLLLTSSLAISLLANLHRRGRASRFSPRP